MKLLSIIKEPREYFSIDISKKFLFTNAKTLSINFPKIKVTAIWADYKKISKLLKLLKEKNQKLVSFLDRR